MSGYRKVKNEPCERCSGESKTKKQYLKTLEECLHCNGFGHRAIYENEDAHERSVTVGDHKRGIISSYFGNFSD